MCVLSVCVSAHLRPKSQCQSLYRLITHVCSVRVVVKPQWLIRCLNSFAKIDDCIEMLIIAHFSAGLQGVGSLAAAQAKSWRAEVLFLQTKLISSNFSVLMDLLLLSAFPMFVKAVLRKIVPVGLCTLEDLLAAYFAIQIYILSASLLPQA